MICKVCGRVVLFRDICDRCAGERGVKSSSSSSTHISRTTIVKSTKIIVNGKEVSAGTDGTVPVEVLQQMATQLGMSVEALQQLMNSQGQVTDQITENVASENKQAVAAGPIRRVECPHCSRKVPVRNGWCMYCGHELPAQETQTQSVNASESATVEDVDAKVLNEDVLPERKQEEKQTLSDDSFGRRLRDL